MQGEIDVDRLPTAPGANACLAIADQLNLLVGRMTALVEEIGSLQGPGGPTVSLSGK